MQQSRQSGFTLIEVLITVTIFGVISALVMPALVATIRVVGYETSFVRMDQDAHRSLNEVTAHLRGAVLPIITDPKGSLTPAKILNQYKTDQVDNNSISFQDIINSTQGFSEHGAAWRRMLLYDDKDANGGSRFAGSDFVPFAIPVPYIYANGDSSLDSLDSNSLPQLGVRLGVIDLRQYEGNSQPSDSVYTAAAYRITPTVYEGVETLRRYLDGQSIHPYLAKLAPGDLGLTPGELPKELNLGDNRFALNLALPKDANYALGAVRFAPHLYKGKPRVVVENNAAKSGQEETEDRLLVHFPHDINENGSFTDRYVLGRIEVLYFVEDRDRQLITRRFPVSADSVLLQLNTDGNYQPLFRLRLRPNLGDTGSVSINRRSSLVLDINLLMCHELNQQRNIISFGKHVPYITRRYKTSVELRNMSLE